MAGATKPILFNFSSPIWVCITCITLLLFSQVEAYSDYSDTTVAMKADRNCGAYALHLYLQCIGHEMVYQRVLGLCSVGNRGSSLVEIREASARLGVPLQILKVSPTDFQDLGDFAFIAHILTKQVSPQLKASPSTDGHYVMVLPKRVWRKPNEIEFIDGTTGMVNRFSFERFNELWTGYYLVNPKASQGGALDLFDWMLVASLSCQCVLVSLLRPVSVLAKMPLPRTSLRAGNVSAIAFLTSISWCTLVGVSTVKADQIKADVGTWRIPERELENTLYLWLRLNSMNPTYECVVDRCMTVQRPVSLLEVANLSKGFGVRVDIVHGTIQELLQQRRPTIIYLDGADGRHGFFAIFISKGLGDQVFIIDSSSATVVTMETDEFLRNWTGHYLSTPFTFDVVFWAPLVLVAAFGVYVCCYLFCISQSLRLGGASQSSFVMLLATACFVSGCGDDVRTSKKHAVLEEQIESSPFRMTSYFVSPMEIGAERLAAIRRLSYPLHQGMTASLALHALMSHGIDAQFDHPNIRSGEDLWRAVTDDAAGIVMFGSPTLIQTRHGVRSAIIVDDPRAREHHRDQLLAVMAKLGSPLATPLRVQNEDFTLKDLLTDSIANYTVNQIEIEWTALAYALYLPPQRSWTNKFGETFSFDDLAERVLSRNLGSASCCGSHVVWAMIAMVQVDTARGPILSKENCKRLKVRIEQCVASALETQNDDGSWGADWSRGESMPESPQQFAMDADSLSNRLVATSHIPQWMLTLPPGVRLPDRNLHLAGEWLLRVLDGVSDEAFARDHYCPVSHAAALLSQLSEPERAGPSEPAPRVHLNPGSLSGERL